MSPNSKQLSLLTELETLSKTLVWYSPSQIEIGQHLNDPGTYGDRPWSISPETGKFLYDFILKNKIKSIVELGTGIGYSGIWMGLALREMDGKLFTIEKRGEKVKIAKTYFEKANVQEIITIYNEEIITAIPKIIQDASTVDLLFFDANRSKFSEYLEALFPIINQKTYLIVDNTIDMKERLETFKQVLENSSWKIEEHMIGDGLWICQK